MENDCGTFPAEDGGDKELLSWENGFRHNLGREE